MNTKVHDGRTAHEKREEDKVRAALVKNSVMPAFINTYVAAVYEDGDMEHDYEGLGDNAIYAYYLMYVENGA